jgi:hypothetical protein
LLAGISIVGFIAGLVVTGLAVAGGGDSIASAPDVPLGASQVASRDGIDYWRVNLNTGDLLVVDLGSVDGDRVGLCLWRPEVTNYTSATTQCKAYVFTAGKTELTFKAGPSGKWSLAFLDPRYECNPTYPEAVGPRGSWTNEENRIFTDEVQVDPLCKLNVSYEFTTYVKAYTAATLRIGSGVVAANKFVTFAGSVRGSGVTGGKVELQGYVGGWKTFAVVKVGGNGSFSYKARFREPGTYKIRARYAGDATHLPSTVVISVGVI